MRRHPGINMAHIPASGIAGLIFAVATLSIFFVGLPACRWLLLFSAPAGLILGGVIYFRHRRNR